MKLLAVRDLNAQDPLPTLGPKVEPPAPPPPPALRPTATPGVMQRPDGKLETDLPMPASYEAQFTRPLVEFGYVSEVMVSAKQMTETHPLVEFCQRHSDGPDNQVFSGFVGHNSPKRASRRSYEDCQKQCIANRAKEFPTPLMVPVVIYPMEAWQDNLIACPPHRFFSVYADQNTASVVISLPGKTGADYFP